MNEHLKRLLPMCGLAGALVGLELFFQPKPAAAQTVPSAIDLIDTTAEVDVLPVPLAQVSQNDNGPSDPRDRRDPDIFEERDREAIEDESGGNDVEVFLRLNTELFAEGGDLVEFEIPIRYTASDRLFIQASPVFKYFPENSDENFDYGFKFAVEYRLTQ